jgi:hypothetical protein
MPYLGNTHTSLLTTQSLNITGDADIGGTLEADVITVDGITLSETIADTVGAMVTSNNETGITVTYQDLDNTLDFVIGTLNQNTTGSAATLTTPRAIGGVNFNGFADINLPGVNAAGNQNTTGSAATLTTTRAIALTGDVSGTANFNGSVGITITTTIADNAIDSEHYTDGSIDTEHIAAGNVTQAKIADQAINEAKMQISNAPQNGYTLTAQSGNTGGMTWAEAGGGGGTAVVASTILGSAAASITVTGFSTTYDLYRLEFDLIATDDGVSANAEETKMFATNDSGTAYTDNKYQVLKIGDLSGTNRADQNEWRTQTTGMHAVVLENGNNNAGSQMGPVGHGYMMIMNPKNTSRAFHADVYFAARTDIASERIVFVYEGHAKDIGGVQYVRIDGGNFATNSRLTLIGYNKS